MKKITKIALVLLVCALLLGVGGGFLLASESSISFSQAPTMAVGGYGSVAYFECPVADPNCHPRGP